MDIDTADVEIPEYFMCPISLEIMKDPVTAITGITYDRDSIERWLFDTLSTATTPHCPVTNRPLPRDSDLTPNHMLRRLIQSWCTQNASWGIDRIPTPRAPLDRFRTYNLIITDQTNLANVSGQMTDTLRDMEVLAGENKRNRKHMAEAGTPKAVLSYVVACFDSSRTVGLKEALSILNQVPIPSAETRAILLENDRIIDALLWVLQCVMENRIESAVKSDALSVLKRSIDAASSFVLQRLKPYFSRVILSILRSFKRDFTQQGLNLALHIMLGSCPWGKNRLAMLENQAAFELIELELAAPPGKRTTELIFGVLFHLCSCAEGRAQLISHRAGIAVISKRILRVSPTVDDQAMMILSLVCKFSGTVSVVREMVMVGAVSKLCTVIQSESAPFLRDKAREILRSNSEVWKDFPCIKNSKLTRYFY